MNDSLLRDLELLTGLMEQGGWKSLRVTSKDICLNLSHSPGDRAPFQSAARQSVAGPAPAAEAAAAQTSAPAPGASPAPAAIHEPDPAWAVVAAPNLGTFYRSPKPGSPPFVEVGQAVQNGEELCLIEVMKLFTSVRADISGTVRHIAAADAQLVEGGQPLMYIETE